MMIIITGMCSSMKMLWNPTVYIYCLLQVVVEVVNAPISFPAVTVCSNYHIRSDVAEELEKLRLDRNFSTESTQPHSYLVDKYLEYVMNVETLKEAYFGRKKRKWKRNRHRIGGYMYRLKSRAGLLANIGPELSGKLGVHLHDFIVSCTFSGLYCNTTDDFSVYLHNYYFKCFTFNPNVSDANRGRILRGVDYGLSILFYTGAGDIVRGAYGMERLGSRGGLSAVSSGRGIRFVVHAQGTEPHPIAEGLDILPGQSVSVGVKATEIERLNSPYGDCSTADSIDRYKYSIVTCQLGCIQHEIIDKCQCADSDLITVDKTSNGNVTFCEQLPDIPLQCQGKQADNETCREHLDPWYKRLVCRENVSTYMTSMDSSTMANCQCYPPCNDTSYSLSYSVANLPNQSRVFSATVKRFLKQSKYGRKLTYSANSSSLEEVFPYFARLNVHIADTNIARTMEVPDYDSNALISDIGGQLGLWVGISIITLVEVTDLFISLLSYFICNKKTRRPVHHSTELDEMRDKNGQFEWLENSPNHT